MDRQLICVLVIFAAVANAASQGDEEPTEHHSPKAVKLGRGFLSFGFNQLKKLFVAPLTSSLIDETYATEEVINLVKHHTDKILRKAKFDDVGPKPAIETLTFLKIKSQIFDFFLVKIVIGNKHIAHVKIGRAAGDGPEKSRLFGVLTNKLDSDRLNMEEFGENTQMQSVVL